MTGGVLKIARRIWVVGVASWPVTGRRRGAFSTLLRRHGLRASCDGVLATKGERKMLASTCLYLLYAWLIFCTLLHRITAVNNTFYGGGLTEILFLSVVRSSDRF